MKWIVASENSLSGLGLEESKVQPDNSHCGWPVELPEILIEVVDVAFEYRRNKNGDNVCVDTRISVNPHLADLKLSALPDGKEKEDLKKELEEMAERVVVVHDGTGPKIVKADSNVQPQNFLAEAPQGIEPGDEKYVSLEGRTVSFDLQAKRLAEPGPKPEPKKKTWNEMTILERFKSKFFKQ